MVGGGGSYPFAHAASGWAVATTAAAATAAAERFKASTRFPRRFSESAATTTILFPSASTSPEMESRSADVNDVARVAVTHDRAPRVGGRATGARTPPVKDETQGAVDMSIRSVAITRTARKKLMSASKSRHRPQSHPGLIMVSGAERNKDNDRAIRRYEGRYSSDSYCYE